MKVKIPADHQAELRRGGHDKAVKNITPRTHETMVALVAGKSVEAEDAFDALFEILASCATRFGQSMARRSASKGVLDCYRWIREQATPLAPTAAQAVKKAKIEAEVASTDRDLAHFKYAQLLYAVEQVLVQSEAMPMSADVRFLLGLENLLTPEHRTALDAYRKGAAKAKRKSA